MLLVEFVVTTEVLVLVCAVEICGNKVRGPGDTCNPVAVVMFGAGEDDSILGILGIALIEPRCTVSIELVDEVTDTVIPAVVNEEVVVVVVGAVVRVRCNNLDGCCCVEIRLRTVVGVAGSWADVGGCKLTLYCIVVPEGIVIVWGAKLPLALLLVG